MPVKRAFKIGVFLNFYTNSLVDWEKQFNLLNQLSGVDCVELLIEEVDPASKRINLIKKHLEKYEKLIHAPFIGLSFISPYKEIQQAAVQILGKTINFAKEINAKIVTTHTGVIGAFYNTNNIESYVNREYLNLVNSKTNSPLITVENLPKKHAFIQSYPSLMEINTERLWQNCNLTLDIGHAILDKIDYLKFLESHISCIKNIHLHNIVKGKEHESIAKKGKLKLNGLFDMLTKLDYRGFVNLEIPDEKNLIDSWNYLRPFRSDKNGRRTGEPNWPRS